jgi:hypothetical protein
MMTKVLAPSSSIGFNGCMMRIGQKHIPYPFLYHATKSEWFILPQPVFHLLAEPLPTPFQYFQFLIRLLE